MTGDADARQLDVVVAGIGNEYRRDDGAGVAAAARVVRVDTSVRDVGPVVDPLDLLGRWDGADLAVVVDAVRARDPAGTVRVVGLQPVDALGGPGLHPDTVGRNPTSSHGVDLRGALRLARAVGQAPRRVVLVGIVGSDFGHGLGLTAPVDAAVEDAAGTVLDLIWEARSCA